MTRSRSRTTPSLAASATSSLTTHVPSLESQLWISEWTLEELRMSATPWTWDTWDPDSSYIVSTSRRVKWFFGRLFWKKEKKYTVDEFFNLIKEWLSETNYKMAVKYKKEIVSKINQCMKLGQQTMIDKLNSQLAGIKKEMLVLARLWLKKYVYESDICDLENKGIEGRSIRRKTLERYEGIIPEDKQKEILTAKKSWLFDEIIVIYTRKRERPVALDKKVKTKDPVRENVDPICFGKITGTGRLFIISDRTDDECDFDMKKLDKLVGVKKIV